MTRFLFVVTCLLLISAGCGSTGPQADKKAETGAPAEHGHGAGPHGGAVADWGGGAYHVEFTVDHDNKQATVYILGSDEKTPAPVKAEKLLLSINDPAFQVDLLPKPQEGEVAGASSRFVGNHENLGTVQEFAGTISGEVDGTPYAGDFSEEATRQRPQALAEKSWEILEHHRDAS
jgi:hypothetical protein